MTTFKDSWRPEMARTIRSWTQSLPKYSKLNLQISLGALSFQLSWGVSYLYTWRRNSSIGLESAQSFSLQHSLLAWLHKDLLQHWSSSNKLRWMWRKLILFWLLNKISQSCSTQTRTFTTLTPFRNSRQQMYDSLCCQRRSLRKSWTVFSVSMFSILELWESESRPWLDSMA